MNAYFKGQPVFGPRGPAGPDGNPIGTIISYMGLTAPADYLACDGAEYSISDYPSLAAHFAEQFGEANHFGGDGVSTFAVPNIPDAANEDVLYCIKAFESVPGGIEEYDTDDGWHVRKWSDGYVEMTLSVNENLPGSDWSAWGNIYNVQSDKTSQYLYPVALKVKYFEIFIPSTVDYAVGITCGSVNHKDRTGAYGYSRGTAPGLDLQVTRHFFVCGRWK